MKTTGEQDTGFVPRQILICKCRVQNRQNQSDLQSKLNSATEQQVLPGLPYAKCTACAKCSELRLSLTGEFCLRIRWQNRGWCRFSRLSLTGEFCLRIRWRGMSWQSYASLIWYEGKILQSNAAAKMCTNREFGHPPRCILHTQCIFHTPSGQSLLLSFDCRSDCFWGFCTLPDQNLSPHKTGVLLTRLFYIVLSSTFAFSKKCTRFRRLIWISQFMFTQTTLVPLTKLLQVPVFNSRFILHSILPSIPCLTTKWKIKTKTSITSCTFRSFLHISRLSLLQVASCPYFALCMTSPVCHSIPILLQ